MEKVILTQLTLPELQVLCQDSVRRELQNFFTDHRPVNLLESDQFTLPDGIRFLKDKGYPNVSKSTFYKLTSKNLIPYQTFGRKLIFKRSDLLAWAESQKKA